MIKHLRQKNLKTFMFYGGDAGTLTNKSYTYYNTLNFIPYLTVTLKVTPALYLVPS